MTASNPCNYSAPGSECNPLPLSPTDGEGVRGAGVADERRGAGLTQQLHDNLGAAVQVECESKFSKSSFHFKVFNK
jgi:hypothetical protein